MKFQSVGMLVGVVILLSAVISSTTYLVFGKVDAQQSPEPQAVRVSSNDAAAREAGHAIAVPTVPSDFASNGNIFVVRPSNPNLGKRVIRSWSWNGDQSIGLRFEQSTTRSVLGGEHIESVMIQGANGQLQRLEAAPPGRLHPMLVLTWADSQFTYSVSASLAGPLTEQALLAIAESVHLQ